MHARVRFDRRTEKSSCKTVHGQLSKSDTEKFVDENFYGRNLWTLQPLALLETWSFLSVLNDVALLSKYLWHGDTDRDFCCPWA